MVKFNKTWIFDVMLAHFLSEMSQGKKARIINLGGSRSGKTIQTALLLLFLADTYKIEKVQRGDSEIYDSDLVEYDSSGNQLNLIIDVYRNELKKTRKTFEDFIIALSLLGISKNVTFSSPNADRPWIRMPNGNTINFYGLPEDGSELQASAAHIAYFNETLEIKSRKTIKNVVMRCELMVIYDSNPSATVHWLFDMAKDDKRVLNTNSTYKDNPYLPEQTIKEIEDKCPWDLSYYVQKEGSREWHWLLPEHKRPINVENAENNTIDRREWLIYGEGSKCAREGAAFDPIWINEFPEGITYDLVAYGLDFGFTLDETALVRIAVSGRNLYAKLLYYKPIKEKLEDTESSLRRFFFEVDGIMQQEKEEGWLIGDELTPTPILCESQDVHMGVEFVGGLYGLKQENSELPYVFCKVKKYKHKLQGVNRVNMFKLHVVQITETEGEILNFVFEEKDGERTSILHGKSGRNNQDHFIDAMMYAVWGTTEHLVPILN